MSETEKTSPEQQETQAPNKRRSHFLNAYFEFIA